MRRLLPVVVPAAGPRQPARAVTWTAWAAALRSQCARRHREASAAAMAVVEMDPRPMPDQRRSADELPQPISVIQRQFRTSDFSILAKLCGTASDSPHFWRFFGTEFRPNDSGLRCCPPRPLVELLLGFFKRQPYRRNHILEFLISTTLIVNAKHVFHFLLEGHQPGRHIEADAGRFTCQAIGVVLQHLELRRLASLSCFFDRRRDERTNAIDR